MAKRYITTDNARGNQVTASNPTFAHIRGWDAGVMVQATGTSGDTWRVYMTGGSNGAGGTVFLGQVTLGINGPEWEPSPFRTDTDDTRADDFGPGSE